MKRPATQLMYNHCSRFLNQKIYSADNFPIGSITMNKDCPDKLNFRSMPPMLLISVLNEEAYFEPELQAQKMKLEPLIMKKNKLIFLSIIENGIVVGKKIISKNQLGERGRKVKSIPWNTHLIIDRNNNRIKLSGYKAYPEWVKIT